MSYTFVQGIDYGPRRGPVKAFVVHMAEGGGTVGFLRADSTPPARGVSVHYVLEYSGRVVQMLKESSASGSINPNDLRTTNDAATFGATVRKAVMGDWDHDPNSATITLEIEGFAADGPNLTQTVSLVRLVEDVRSRFPDMGLLGHRDFQDYKACPGKLILWDELGGHGPSGDDMSGVNATPTPPIVSGKFTATAGAGTIPANGAPRGVIAEGAIRHAFDGFVLDDLANRPVYALVEDGQLAYVAKSAGTFTPWPTIPPTTAEPAEYDVMVGGKSAGKVVLP